MNISCDGKHGLHEKDMAQRVASRQKSGKANVYKCKVCKLWHIGGTSSGRQTWRHEYRQGALLA